MSSPDYIAFSQFIKIDRRKSDPVYLQIVYQFINAIQRRLLEEGNKIPGSRVLSKELKVHRKTVMAALEELQAQGWIETRPNVGTFINKTEQKTEKSDIPVFSHPYPEHAGFTFRKSFILDAPYQKNKGTYRFTDGQPDYRIIKNNELARFYSAALKRKNTIKRLPDFSVMGNSFFNEQLSYYINLTQGFHISKDHLMYTPGKETLLYIFTQLFVQTGDLILVGALSYPFSNMVFRQAGAILKTIPMDEEGIDIDYIRAHFKKGDIKCVYVQPRHQYPTTISLSVERKTALMMLSEEYDFIIIEDDTNSELTFEKSTTVPIAKRAHHGNIIYLGAFGTFLTPGFRTNFMIAPKDFIEEARKYLNIFGSMDLVKEQALGEMIHEGDIHRYRRKAIKVYQSRRDHFAQLITHHFSDHLRFSFPKGGLAFWFRFNKPLPLKGLADHCRQKGLFLPRICLYQNQTLTALRLGFGHLNEGEMEEAIRILKEGYNFTCPDP